MCKSLGKTSNPKRGKSFSIDIYFLFELSSSREIIKHFLLRRTMKRKSECIRSRGEYQYDATEERLVFVPFLSLRERTFACGYIIIPWISLLIKTQISPYVVV